MKRRGFLNLFCSSAGSCLVPASIAARIDQICIRERRPLLLAPDNYVTELYAVDQCGSYILHLGDPNAEPDYPTFREFIEDKGFDPGSRRSLRKYLLEWRGHDPGSDGPTGPAVDDLVATLDDPVEGYELSQWLDWDFELYDSPMAGAHRFLESLPLADGRGATGIDLGALSFVEGDRPGSNLTYVEVDSLAAIASLQHRLNELDTGARIVVR